MPLHCKGRILGTGPPGKSLEPSTLDTQTHTDGFISVSPVGVMVSRVAECLLTSLSSASDCSGSVSHLTDEKVEMFRERNLERSQRTQGVNEVMSEGLDG